MAYRLKSGPKPKPEDMLPRYAVRNGATLDLSFRCYYYNPSLWHDPHYHDHVGWPDPNHPGYACQMKLPRDINPRLPKPIMRVPGDQVPIHLLDEGYQEAIVVFEDADGASVGIEAEASIDEVDDYIVDAHFDTFFESFHDKPMEFRFTVFVKRDRNNRITRDAVCHGILVVQPSGPYEN